MTYRRELPNYPVWAKYDSSAVHSICAPSSRRRWSLCPASVYESRFARERVAGDAAEFGTEVHEYLARAFALLGNGVPSSKYMDFIKPKTEAHRKVLMDAIDIIFHNVIIKEPIESFLDADNLKTEEFLFFPGLNQLYGVADIIITPEDSNMVYIADLKTGFNVDINYARSQLEAYALMADFNPRYNGKCFVCFIICPRDSNIKTGAFVTGIYGDFPNKYDMSVNCTISELRGKIQNEVARVSVDRFSNDFYHVSNETCKWCKARWICNSSRFAISKRVNDYDPEVKSVSSMFSNDS